MIKLYHGSITAFDEIDLSKGKDYKDFGKGFYATAFQDHADRMAKRNKRIALKRQEMLKQRGLISHAEPVVAYRYNLLFDDTAAEELKIKRFSSADRRWLMFIMKNRKTKGLNHNYDIVIGPTADAQTSMLLNAYEDELIQTDFDESLCSKVIAELMPENLPKQYFFGTEVALKTMRFDRVKRVVVG